MANHNSMWKTLAGLSGAMAVIMGAVAVHALPEPAKAALVEKAAFFQLIFSVVLLQLADKHDRADTMARRLFFLGIVLFCGALYYKAFIGLPQGMMLAPIGGICFILGWLVLAFF